MTKKYNSPMLHIVSINSNDIVCSSPITMDFSNESVTSSMDDVGVAGRRFDDWNEGF